MSVRCSLTKAIELLAPDFDPDEAADTIAQAIRARKHFPLYCNGKVVESHIAATVTVVLYPEEDGRRTADIESIGPGLGWARKAYNWEVEVDAVLALKPQPDTRVESALEKAEAATVEAANLRAGMEAAEARVRAEAEKAWAKAQVQAEKAWAKARAEIEKAQAETRAETEKEWAEARMARERAQASEERMEALEARVEAGEARTKAKTSDNLRRRKPGTKPAYPLWRLEVGHFAYSFHKKNTRMPSTEEVAEHLQIKYDGWAPDESDIREVLRLLRPE